MTTTAAEPVHLSGSTGGKPILVAASSTPGTTIHTATNTAGVFDEVELWASNTDTTDRKLTLEVGGTTAGFTIVQTIPAQGGAVMVYRGRLNGGAALAAFAATANVLNITGTVNRLTVT
jgi:hypothetical protein